MHGSRWEREYWEGLPRVCSAADLVACYCSVGSGLGGQEGDGCEGTCEEHLDGDLTFDLVDNRRKQVYDMPYLLYILASLHTIHCNMPHTNAVYDISRHQHQVKMTFHLCGLGASMLPQISDIVVGY
jgi:hypothetical protein